MAISRANIAKELLPGLNAVFGLEYGEVNNETEPLFESENSDRAFEEEGMFTGFATAPVKGEGAAVSYDTAQETYVSRYTNETVSLAFAITEEAMEDNLYDTFSKLRARGLARAMANTKQVKGANVFNNGFSTAAAYVGGDGVAFFSTSHPTVSDGIQSNHIGSNDLSESALETVLTNVQKIKDDRGIVAGGTSDGTYAQNTINAVRHMGMVPDGFYVNRRFTDTNAWFIKTDVPNGAKTFVRVPLQTKMEPDFDTGNLRFNARERYSFGFSDWRSYFGSPGSS